MKPLVFLLICRTLVSSKFTCNDQEKQILKAVEQQEMGFALIYAMDEKMSSLHSLDIVFRDLNYSSSVPRVPFVFQMRSFRFLLSKVKVPGFCPSSSFFDRIIGHVQNNETMFGVFYGCNLHNSMESLYIVTNWGNPLLPSVDNITINRSFQSKFCKCRQIQEKFTKNCLEGANEVNLWLFAVLVTMAVALALLVIRNFASRASNIGTAPAN